MTRKAYEEHVLLDLYFISLINIFHSEEIRLRVRRTHKSTKNACHEFTCIIERMSGILHEEEEISLKVALSRRLIHRAVPNKAPSNRNAHEPSKETN